MKWISVLLLACALVSCQKTTPREAFGAAVLNCNLMSGFAGPGMQRELEQPSVRLAGENFDQQVTMKRSEVVDAKIGALEESLQKVRKLSVDDDSRAMIEASIALHEFVLPVYRKEYRELAALYDGNADAGRIRALEESIEQQYGAKFASLHEAVKAAGKPYAGKNGIQVQWDVRTAPGG